MKILLLTSIFSLGLMDAFADPIIAKNGDIYNGTLYVNQHPTSKSCQIVIQSKTDAPTKGENCTHLEVVFNFGVSIPHFSQTAKSLFSSVTNYHLTEYPIQKTCALNRDGTALSKAIYTATDEQIYNRVLSGNSKSGRSSFDYFVTISPETRLPISASLHRLGILHETIYDCENLVKVN